MSLLVDDPVINSPFEEPTRYWDYEEGQPVLEEGQGPAGCCLKARTRGAQMALLEEDFVPLELVNTLRERVKGWRETIRGSTGGRIRTCGGSPRVLWASPTSRA